MPKSEIDSWLSKFNNKQIRRKKQIKRTFNLEIKRTKRAKLTNQETFSKVLTILLRPIRTKRI